MNGKDLMEAMSYIDEAYLAEADAPVRRRIPWQPIAAAACVGLAVLGYRAVDILQTPKLAKSADIQFQDACFKIVEETIMYLPASAQMTVRVTGQEDDCLLCTVTDSGSGSIPVGTQLRIAPPELATSDTSFRAAKQEEGTLLYITYDPAAMEEDYLPALQISQADE